MLTVSSTAFHAGERIPVRHTGEGADLSPPLAWSAPPAGTRSLAVLCDDPDAPRPEPWVHWVIFNIPPDTGGLPEGVPRQAEPATPAGARQGVNSWPRDNVGYRGPMPPPGHGVHHYHFRVFALDTVLELPAGTATKEDLLRAIRGHVLAEGELIGVYERK